MMTLSKLSIVLLLWTGSAEAAVLDFEDQVLRINLVASSQTYQVTFRKKAAVYHARNNPELIHCLSASARDSITVKFELDPEKLEILSCALRAPSPAQ